MLEDQGIAFGFVFPMKPPGVLNQPSLPRKRHRQNQRVPDRSALGEEQFLQSVLSFQSEELSGGLVRQIEARLGLLVSSPMAKACSMRHNPA
jgi:hypothetical protein